MNLVDDPQDHNQYRRGLAKPPLTSCPQGIQPLAQLDLYNQSGKPREIREELAGSHQDLGELLQICPVEVKVN
ncbi:hypothetical protein [Roseibium aggregatum]|jgi:hypothetical protein|uniref:hypothetical protein n=1 Tax=Roseibium aggregatum TaxID=187304 RepID=UPI0012F497DD|nr:hypothetical protein [Roseibium aggregatum]